MRTIEILSKLMSGEDKYGNEVSIGETGNIFLKLKSEDRTRDIGTLKIVEDKVYYLKISKEKYIFLKLNAWGINEFILNKLQENDIVIIKTEKKTYESTIKNILENSQYYFFKKQGFEKQIFLPLEKWQ